MSAPTSQPEATPADLLARRLEGSLLAEDLRRVADRPQYAHYRALVLSCLNSVLIEAARTPEKDRHRVLKALHEHGGGTVADVAAHTKLTQPDARRCLAELHACGRVVIGQRGDIQGAEARLYFLPDDPGRLDYPPP